MFLLNESENHFKIILNLFSINLIHVLLININLYQVILIHFLYFSFVFQNFVFHFLNITKVDLMHLFFISLILSHFLIKNLKSLYFVNIINSLDFKINSSQQGSNYWLMDIEI
jgi:hypothetical protein